jgi:hypothetical protein
VRLPILALVTAATPALADPPVVTAAVAARGDGVWQFDVTLAHPDTGWDHYADAWRIEAPDGTVLGLRELAHPHVEEQPFTRSLSGVVLPDGLPTDGLPPEGLPHVLIRPRCLTDGWATEAFVLLLP